MCHKQHWMTLRMPQVLHGKDVVAEGTLKHYNQEDHLPQEKLPLNAHAADADYADVDPQMHSHLHKEEFYALCERQSLQYGPHFQRVHKYAVDRSWCELE